MTGRQGVGAVGGGGGHRNRTAVIWNARNVLTALKMDIKSVAGKTVKWESGRLGMRRAAGGVRGSTAGK